MRVLVYRGSISPAVVSQIQFEAGVPTPVPDKLAEKLLGLKEGYVANPDFLEQGASPVVEQAVEEDEAVLEVVDVDDENVITPDESEDS